MELSGSVERITFRSEDTGFTVLRLATAEGPRICVGALASVREGETLLLRGEWEETPRFGRQLRVQHAESIQPTSPAGIEAMLAGGFVNGIGPHLAGLIVQAFGADTLEVLDKNPKKLLKIKGIGPSKIKMISSAWEEHRHLKDLTLFLGGFGVSAGMIARIHRVYGDRSRSVITENPYSLIDDIRGVGFLKADAIAQHFGFEHNSARRIRAGLLHTLGEASGEGHVMLPREELVRAAAPLLTCDEAEVAAVLSLVSKAAAIIDEDGCCFLPLLHRAEVRSAALLHRLLQTKPPKSEGFEAWLAAYTARSGWQGDPKQIEAVRIAASRGVMVLTGGPGTGKTTTLTVMVEYLKNCNLRLSPCAPTGRAAQRMTEVTGLAAKTIHRLLEYQPSGGGMRFLRDENNPLETDAVIVDEVSMIDLPLFTALLAALRPATRLILVGDSEQLPSVGPGSVLADCITSGTVPHVRLTTVFRQAAKSRIVTAAHQVIHGEIPEFCNGAEDDCFLLTKNTPEDCAAAIVGLVAERIPARYGFNPMKQIQVLTPMHRGPLGTAALNRALQDRLNPGGQRIERGEVIFAAGDKIMQLRNNYETGVFNGDIGTARTVVDGGLIADFDGREVRYEARDLDDLTPAYAISIHKSQGCEFDAVVLALSTQHFIMLQRNLLYTALTRAKKLCIIVGSNAALRHCVHTDTALRRHSRLASRLKNAAGA